MTQHQKYSLLTFVMGLVMVTQTSYGQAKTKRDSLSLDNTITGFLTSFRNLDTTSFDTYFDKAVTVFFPPSANHPTKVTGRDDVLTIFHTFFRPIRKSKAGPPYLTIEPREKSIQYLGQIAIVTFELRDPTLLGRRTIVFKKSGSSWKIIHLHASGVPYK